MDRNTVVGLLLIFAIVLGVSFYNSSQQRKVQQEKAEIEAARQIAIQDSLAQMIHTDSLAFEMMSNEQKEEGRKEKGESESHVSDHASLVTRNSPFFIPDTLANAEYVVETDRAVYRFSKMGGYLNFAHLKDIYAYAPKDEERLPLILFDGRNTAMNMDLMLQNQMIVKTQFCYFASEQSDTLLVTENNNVLSLKLYPVRDGEIDKTSYIEYLYTFSNEVYSFGFHINYVNMQYYLYPNTSVFTLQWDASLLNVERSWEVERNITTIFYMDNLNNVSELNTTKSDKKDFSSQLKWVSFKQQFFTTVLVADSGYFSSGQLATDVRSVSPVLKHLAANLEFDVRNLYNGSFDMTMFIGPNQFSSLKTYGLHLERQVPIGWGFFLLHWINRGVVIPVFDWLSGYAISYGIIILILTILLKIVLMPVAYKTYLSSARMRVLKPEMEEINAKFPKQEDAMKKQQATMALYRSAGVNPMSGCLPVLLQMPILIAMFRFFPSAYELRQQPFLWADDLSTYDSVVELGFNIPFYGDHVSLFCLLMTAATLLYTWLNNKMMTMGNPEQMKMMRFFMYLMPIMFLGIFNNFAAGLTYYYLLVNLITFLQMWIFRVGVDEKKIRLRLQANMAKPKKKSKWQTRMEEMVKQQQMQQKGRK